MQLFDSILLDYKFNATSHLSFLARILGLSSGRHRRGDHVFRHLCHQDGPDDWLGRLRGRHLHRLGLLDLGVVARLGHVGRVHRRHRRAQLVPHLSARAAQRACPRHLPQGLNGDLALECYCKVYGNALSLSGMRRLINIGSLERQNTNNSKVAYRIIFTENSLWDINGVNLQF